MRRPRFGWPETCMGLLTLAIAGIVGSAASLTRLGVDGAFALSGLSLLALAVGVAGLVYWAFFDVMRRSLPWEARILFLGLIFLLVPLGAILYYGLSVRYPPSPPPTPPPD